MKKYNKYGNKKTIVDGINFDSKAEARYYTELKLREQAGEIEIIEIQPKVYLTDARILYKPDFLIRETQGPKVWIDVKGFETPVFKIKKKLWAHYGPGRLDIVNGRNVVSVEVIA